jgi:hypothetical protein
MVVSFESLPVSIAKSEASQVTQTGYLVSDRARQVGASEETQNAARADEISVKESESIEGRRISENPEESGNPSYYSESNPSKKEEETKGEKIAIEEGKGELIDVMA